jgi:uncharacterized protein with HEPN domain
MPSKNPAQRLRDIVDNIDAIAEFTAKIDFAAFVADRKTVYAVVRALEIVSPALRRLPAEIRDRHSEIDWVAVAAADNVYRHEYETVDETLIWHTVKRGLAALRGMATTELDQLRSA